MVSFSKLLSQGLRDARCVEVFHPGTTCSEFHFGHSFTCFLTFVKYFFPIVTVPLLVKGRNLRKEHIRDAFKFYIELVMTGFLTAQGIPIAMCGIRNLCGEFSRCNFLYIPMTVPTWTMFFTSARVARLFAASIFQVTLEAAIRKGRNPVLLFICQSKIIQTLMFMMCSAFVLHAIQENEIKIFWIVKSIPRPTQEENEKCIHDGPCTKFCLSDLAKNLLIGISLDLFKTFFSASKGKTFSNKLIEKIVKLNFPTTFFLSSYSCIYRITSCLLNRYQKHNPNQKHITAAFLGGSSFYFMPRLTMLCYAIAVSIEISWKLFQKRESKNKSKFIEIIKNIQFHRLYICLSAGYMVHTYVFHYHVLSPMGVAIVSAFTGNRAPHMKANILKYFKSIEK